MTTGARLAAKVATRHFITSKSLTTMKMTMTRENWILRRCYSTRNDKNRYKVYDDTYKGILALVRYEGQTIRAEGNLEHTTRVLRTTIFRFDKGLCAISLHGRGEVRREGTGFLMTGRRSRSGFFSRTYLIIYRNLSAYIYTSLDS